MKSKKQEVSKCCGEVKQFCLMKDCVDLCSKCEKPFEPLTQPEKECKADKNNCSACLTGGNYKHNCHGNKKVCTGLCIQPENECKENEVISKPLHISAEALFECESRTKFLIDQAKQEILSELLVEMNNLGTMDWGNDEFIALSDITNLLKSKMKE